MKIESTNQLATMIRTQISSMRQASKQKDVRSNPQKGTLNRRSSQAPAKKDVGSSIVQRVAEILSEDPHRRRKTFRVFLESILLEELGEALVADPKFFRMVDDIQRHMESDEELVPVIEQAIDLLLASDKQVL